MFLRYLFRIIIVVAVAGALYLLYNTLQQYSFDEISRALRSIPASNLMLGLAFAAGSYFCLSCNDALAVRYAGKPLPFHQTALASFTGLSIGHNVGVAALSSGAIRYRFYSRWGLTTEEVAKVILFCGMTVGLGLATLGAAAIFLRPDDVARMAGLNDEAISVAALCCFTFPVLYLLLSAFLRTPLHIRNWRFQMPSLPIAVGQTVVGTVNFALVAASLHQMLTAFGEAAYLQVATASITANIAAIVSHIPGGLGVLEATIVHILPGAESIAAVIAFRVIYYFIPLAIGLSLLVGSEFVLKSGPELNENAK
ncbi:lysylphosphatidylglycerol synthase domain-containing protein [Rhizobium sp. LjRoot254]|uniref:lysylphosphatidylglycerol synthase domain-containing protein n=1 Tax=Rhizobium sp. LjRoot254 TaxID=3342297 RepID=UPI003ECC62D6